MNPAEVSPPVLARPYLRRDASRGAPVMGMRIEKVEKMWSSRSYRII